MAGSQHEKPVETPKISTRFLWANQELRVQLQAGVSKILGEEVSLNNKQLIIAWERLAPRQRHALWRLYRSQKPPSRDQLARKLNVSPGYMRAIDIEARRCLVLEIWAAITGFSGLSKRLLLELCNFPITTPDELSVREKVNNFIIERRINSAMYRELKAWLEEHRPDIEIKLNDKTKKKVGLRSSL